MAPRTAASLANPIPLMAVFPLLVDEGNYEPNTFVDTYQALAPTAPGLPCCASWLEVFRKSIPTFSRHALTDASLPTPEARQAASERFASTFGSALDALEADPTAPLPSHPACFPVNCLTLCQLREECLRQAGVQDAFLAVKTRENQAALDLLPSLLTEFDGEDSTPARLELALRGVFAGNLFDLGAAGSAAQYESGGASASTFGRTRDQLLPRPWVVDDLDAALDQLAKAPYRHVLVFVDNAGSDLVLGMLPLARELLKQGAKVTIAANEVPSINDITAAELATVLQQAGSLDPAVLGPALASGQLQGRSSGSDLPVIDLRQVARPLCEEVVAEAVDCVILEGMGRSIETNLHAQLTVDCFKLGMVKHPEVAACLGGRLYDCVCKFTPGKSPAASS